MLRFSHIRLDTHHQFTTDCLDDKIADADRESVTLWLSDLVNLTPNSDDSDVLVTKGCDVVLCNFANYIVLVIGIEQDNLAMLFKLRWVGNE